jgi:hypothetical protein
LSGVKLLFLHIPKAGGSALGGAIGNRFAADQCLWLYYTDNPADEEVGGARFVCGHVSMSLVDRFDQPPYVITVLRDPIERALSTYSRFREFDRPFPSRPQMERNTAARRLAQQHSIDEFIRLAPDLAEHYFGNWQARMLGAKSLDRADELLEDAVAGLHRCDLVGLAERQDEFVDCLTDRLGWAKLAPLPQANPTSARLRREQVSDEAMEVLLDLTTVDRELYAEAVKLYEDRQAESSGRSAASEDRGAEIEDAPLASDLPFGQPIRGTGWHRRDRDGHGRQVCWIGHTGSASVELAADPEARSIVVEIAHVLDPAALGTLQIKVDGEPLRYRLAESDGGVIASAPLDEALGRDKASARVELAVDYTTRPCDVDPSSDDNRELGIAVSRIALSSRPAA